MTNTLPGNSKDLRIKIVSAREEREVTVSSTVLLIMLML